MSSFLVHLLVLSVIKMSVPFHLDADDLVASSTCPSWLDLQVLRAAICVVVFVFLFYLCVRLHLVDWMGLIYVFKSGAGDITMTGTLSMARALCWPTLSSLERASGEMHTLMMMKTGCRLTVVSCDSWVLDCFTWFV